MALTRTFKPDDCLIGTGSCFELCYTSDNLVTQPGTLAAVALGSAAFNDFQIGSTITVNGQVFTSAAVTNINNNEFEQGGTQGDTLDNFYTVFSQNYWTETNATLIVYTAGSSFAYRAKDCDVGWQIDFDNLTAGNVFPSIVVAATPLILRGDFTAKVALKRKTVESGTQANIGEIIIPISSTDISEDGCTLNDHELCKDISELINPLYNVPLPRITDVTVMTKFDEGAFMIDGVGTEFYDNQTHSISLFSNKFVVPSMWDKTNVNRLTEYCVNGGFKMLSPYESGDTICSDSLNWFYIAHDAPIGHEIKAYGTLYDSTGATHTFQLLETGVDSSTFVTEIMGAPCQLTTFFTGKVDLCDLNRFVLDINVDVSGGGATVATSQIDLNVKCKRETQNFIFKNSFGYYSGISANPFNSEEFSVLREYVEFCEPCIPNAATKRKKIVRSEGTQSFNAVLHRFHSLKVIKEFFASDEFYWVNDTEIYAIEMQFDEGVIDQRNTETDITFKFNLL